MKIRQKALHRAHPQSGVYAHLGIVVLGRPKVHPKVECAILRARKQGKGMLRIAKEVGCGVGTVQRVVKEKTA